MKIVWATLWFLDYRIPVFEALSKLTDVEFILIYNKDVNSDRINQKVEIALGKKAIPLTGEIRLGSDSVSGFANKAFRIPYQPGLIKQINKLKPDVIISDGFFQWTYAPLFLRATKGIPHVMCYERTNHTERNAQRIRTIYRKFALNFIDVICCSGILCGKYIEELGFNSSHLTYGHMVADVNSLSEITNQLSLKGIDDLKSKWGLTNPTYLYVGQIIKRKGVLQLIDAWKEFSKQISNNANLVLIGQGDYEELIKAEIQNSNIETIKFLGPIPYDEIARFYNMADIFIIPTLEDNWSLVVSEAMACGLPVISSVYNGCYPELVTKMNGWVMDPLNHENFVNTLVESYERRGDFRKMGEASLNIVKRFTPITAAKNIYESCIQAIKQRKDGYSK